MQNTVVGILVMDEIARVNFFNFMTSILIFKTAREIMALNVFANSCLKSQFGDNSNHYQPFICLKSQFGDNSNHYQPCICLRIQSLAPKMIIYDAISVINMYYYYYISMCIIWCILGKWCMNIAL